MVVTGLDGLRLIVRPASEAEQRGGASVAVPPWGQPGTRLNSNSAFRHRFRSKGAHPTMAAVGLGLVIIVILFLLIVLLASVKIVKEYERGVVFRLGRLVGPRGPGLILLLPFIERMVKVDLRTVTMDVPAQEVITRDNVTVRVNAVSYFRVIDPSAAMTNVTDYIRATSQIAQTTLAQRAGTVLAGRAPV